MKEGFPVAKTAELNLQREVHVGHSRLRGSPGGRHASVWQGSGNFGSLWVTKEYINSHPKSDVREDACWLSFPNPALPYTTLASSSAAERSAFPRPRFYCPGPTGSCFPFSSSCCRSCPPFKRVIIIQNGIAASSPGRTLFLN